MKNAILPSVSSQLYSYGSNVAETEIPVQMDSKVNVYGSSFCIDSRLYNSQDQLGEGFAIRSQSSINFQPGLPSTMKILDYPCIGSGYQTNMSSCDNVPQQPLSVTKMFSVQKCEADFQAIQNSRKRPIQINELPSQRSSNNLISNKSVLNEVTTNKKMAVCFQGQRRPTVKKEIKETPTIRVPAARRSQKLSERITALQKLVSPYGKTDTASVLQEAYVSIKVLQDQIQNFFDVLSPSQKCTKPLPSQLQKSGERQLDLRSKGLCLVPVSFTHKLTMKGYFD